MVNIETGGMGENEFTKTECDSRFSPGSCKLTSVTSSPRRLLYLTQATAVAAGVLGKTGDMLSSPRLLKRLLFHF